MNNIPKITNIALIFTLIGVFLCVEAGYALRPPVTGLSRKKELLSEQLQKATEEYQLYIESARLNIAAMFMLDMLDQGLCDKALIKTYADFFMAINYFLTRYIGTEIPITYIYPFMGRDVIPLALNKTIGINDDIKDLDHGIKILNQAYNDTKIEYFRPIFAEYSNKKLNAMKIKSYSKVTKSIKGVKVLILKGFKGWAEERNDPITVANLLRNVFDAILQEGDIILILDKDDLKGFMGLAKQSGFFQIGPEKHSLFDGVEPVAYEYPKVLLVPSALVIMQKKPRVDTLVPAIKDMNYCAPSRDL